jgi:hypothetical protein
MLKSVLKLSFVLVLAHSIASNVNCAAANDVSLPGAPSTSFHVGHASYEFNSRWEALSPSPVAASSVPYKILKNAQTHYREVNAEHVQLSSGALVISAKGKALFVSQKMKNELLMVRVAPGAVALISSGEVPVVANLSKRCCGAVLVYFPVPLKDRENAKVNVLSGNAVELWVSADGKAAPRDNCGPLNPNVKVVDTTVGKIEVVTDNIDIDAVMKTLVAVPD